MSMHDPIADFIVAVMNAQRVSREKVSVPHSKMKLQISQILKEQGYIASLGAVGEGAGKRLELTLKYYNGKPVIEEFKRISKPSLRRYVGADDMPSIKNGFGEAIVSTNQGLMTAKEAQKKRVGGEVVCTVF